MGVTTRDLFGASRDTAPATPGSYGAPPAGPWRLPPDTRPGPVRLQVSDLERSLAFWVGLLGLRPTGGDASVAELGAADGTPLVVLEARPGTRPVARRGRLGLYHVALLLPGRPALGRFVAHLARRGVPAGAGDHLVSEAFYLTDPDGLGVEVYADRPRELWRRTGRQLVMGTDPVDVPDLLRTTADAPEWAGMPAGTTVGHVHLHVGALDAASAFYADALGFDRMVWQYPGALFLAAGGYHHHLGVNSWAGPAATPPAADEAQLLEWTLVVPDPSALDGVAASLAAAGHPVERPSAGAVVTRDPWGTRLRLVAGA